MSNNQGDMVIDEDVMRRCVGHVLPGVEDFSGLDTRFDEIGLDSMLLAELIVQLEEETDGMLDLHVTGRLETLRDLMLSLRPLREAE
ncbi:acyl carrier protein [Streptomyces natalensis]|uniref:Carrier domain-containing protein n=1 Tax=Streptomyces natalensis ATCC 27448 TaxID=1240678 RepID=A0A0D7CIS0_9ACTN|nr:acyl carrier protein [Streptomyces natalensis]KIZ15730.1 hypothetical protein SNA_25025 [Streptomyces natalensis ATCC 27448]